jgi:hypothetical protein
VARGIIDGKVPYLDFFDHKGPLVYFINYLGLRLGGIGGIWFLELLMFFVAVSFAYKTALLLLADKFSAFFGTCLTLLLFSSFMAENIPEIHVQMFIAISLYIFTKQIIGFTTNGTRDMLIAGFWCGAALMLKPNLIAVWVAVGTGIIIRKLLQRDYRNLIQFGALFIAGTLTATIPFLAYLALHDALGAFWEQYIGFNSRYAAHVKSSAIYLENFYALMGIRKTGLILLISIVALVVKRGKKDFPFYAAYLGTLLLAFFAISYSAFSFGQYSLALIMLYVPAMTLAVKWGSNTLQSRGIPRYATFALVVVASLLLLNREILNTGNGVHAELAQWKNEVAPGTGDYGLKDVKKICRIIRENSTRTDSITVIGNSCQIYLYSGRASASKYISQSVVLIAPEICREYQQEIIAKNPKIVVIPPYFSSGKVDEALIQNWKKFFPELFILLNSEYVQIFNEPRTAIIYKHK